ncbi:MAG: YdbL family protein [Betaproteobacteria bacterium]
MRAGVMHLLAIVLPAVFVLAVNPVHAQAESELETSTPAIITLQKSMASRFVQFRPQFEAGVIGVTSNGALAVRDTSAIDAKALFSLDVLLQEENRDRATLYREIARANQHPEWESDLRATFGKRWISRIPPGWYYRDSIGKWQRK